tara:strand:- start:58 stop:852 length:795 start_codon:yes stop_codon:yes gene_type:complete
MAFNKIQPEQIQLATFFSNSGDIAINQTDTGVALNLSRGITGDFSFTGDSSRPFQINEKPVITSSHASNSSYTFESGSFAINGSVNTLISGVNNVGINVEGVSISGNADNNTIINGEQSTIGSGSKDCFAVGRQISFTPPTTGAVVFSDFAASNAVQTKGNDTFLVDFTGGSYFEGGNTYHLNNIHVSPSSSGLFSGDLNVLGDTFLTGLNVSGVATFNSGFTLPQWKGTTMAGTSGSMAVSGTTLTVFLNNGWVGIGTTSISY